MSATASPPPADLPTEYLQPGGKRTPVTRIPVTVTPLPPRFPLLPNVAGYDVLAEVGRGGMGVVYKARHRKLDRVVALKVILGGRYADESDRQRFTREAEAVARLTHPHIVEVFDLGESDGNTFIAFEYLPGGTLFAAARTGRFAAADAARLGEQVARAVQHAHDHGVLHRDLKPGNILLDADGSPKVGDFGLAKRLDDGEAGLTATGDVCGTPQYMPPELVLTPNPEYGPTVDVYGIGAILFELLCGRPPVTGANSAEVLAKLATAVPPSVRATCRTVPRDLAVIVDKCLERDPTRRYPTAGAVADELARFGRGEAIRARPVGRVTRTARWCRRYPTVAALLLVLGVATVAATAAAVSLGRSVEREQAAQEALRQSREEAVRARNDADAARRAAEADFAEVRKRVLVLVKELTDKARANDEADRERRMTLMSQLRPLCELLLRKLPDDPTLQLYTAQIGMAVAHLQYSVGEYDEACGTDRDAERILRGLADRFPADPTPRHELACLLSWRSFLYLQLDREAECDAPFAEAERLFLALRAAHPDATRHAIELANLWHNRVSVFHARRRFDDILPLSVRAVELMEGLSRERPDHSPTWVAYSSALQDLGIAYRFLGRHREAERYFRLTVDIRTERLNVADDLFPLPRRQQDLARALDNYGLCLMQLGRPVDAAEAFRSAVPHLTAAVAAHPKSPVLRMELARCQLHLGTALVPAEGVAATLPYIDRAAELIEPLLVEDDRAFHLRLSAAELYRRRATAREATGKPLDAAADWERAGKYQQDGPPGQARYLAARAVCLLKGGKADEAGRAAAAAFAEPGRLIEADYELARYFAVLGKAGGHADCHLRRSLTLLEGINARGYFYPRTRQANYDTNPDFDVVRGLLRPVRQPPKGGGPGDRPAEPTPPVAPAAPAGARGGVGTSGSPGGNP